MKGKVSEDVEVGVDADALWDVYGSPNLGKFINEWFPNIIEVEVMEGDGGVGTVLFFTFPSVTPGFKYFKEKCTKIDNEKRLKETEIVEGGYLHFGFSLYRNCFEIIEKDDKSSIIRSSIEYETADEHTANASLVSSKSLGIIAKAIGKYLVEKKKLLEIKNLVEKKVNPNKVKNFLV